MTAQRIDIIIEQGADFQYTFPALNASITTADLTCASAAMQIRAAFDDPTALATLTTANGGLTINPTTRRISAFIDNALTESLPAGIFLYDMKLLTSSGMMVRPYQGTATVSPEVTVIDPPPSPCPSPSPTPAPSPSPSPTPSPDVYGTSGGDTYGTSDGDEYGPQ